MQQRQLRLGDILDDYCPRERRVTNHVVVAMIGADVKQTRCTTCDSDHEYKHAKVPKQRRKSTEPAALYAQVVSAAPKRVAHEAHVDTAEAQVDAATTAEVEAAAPEPRAALDTAEGGASPRSDSAGEVPSSDQADQAFEAVHRPLIRATLPRPEGQPPPQRPAPDFTVRQPGGRPGRFRPRHQRGGQFGNGNRSGGNVAGGYGSMRGGPPRHLGSRPQGVVTRSPRQHGQGSGRKRSK